MSATDIDVSWLDLSMIVARGLLILGLLRVLGWLIELAPMPRRRKEVLQAAGPLFAVTTCLVYLFLSVQEIFGRFAAAKPLLLSAILIGFVAALWTPIRDLLAGAFLKLGRVVRVGDEVQIQEVHGRVERLFYRRMVVRTAQGEAILPYSLVTRQAIVRASTAVGPAAYTFRVRAVDGFSLVELRERVRTSALLCHWSSPVREPELVPLPEGGLEVTAFAVDAAHAPEIESAVRKSLAALEAASAPSAVTHLSHPPPLRNAGEGHP